MADTTTTDTPVAIKPAIQSKTLWVNFILAAAALFLPPANAWVTAHPDIVVGVFTVVNMILRFVTKTGIQVT